MLQSVVNRGTIISYQRGTRKERYYEGIKECNTEKCIGYTGMSDIEQEGGVNMTVRDLYIYSRDGHTFILFKEGETKSCFKGSLEDCPPELFDKLVYQFRAIDFNTIEVVLIW